MIARGVRSSRVTLVVLSAAYMNDHLAVFGEQLAAYASVAKDVHGVLAWRVGWDLVTGREQVRVARKLGEFLAIDDALRRGEVSYSKVRALVRVATPANEVLLLDYARRFRGIRRDDADARTPARAAANERRLLQEQQLRGIVGCAPDLRCREHHPAAECRYWHDRRFRGIARDEIT